MSLSALTVYNPGQKKVRIGSAGDGGYVIAEGLEYDVLISCGISDDINFEIDFLKTHTVPCLAFDGTVNCLPVNSVNIEFIKKNISHENTSTTTNLHRLIQPFNNIFLKMDIETFEYRWFQTLSIDQLNKFKQIVIEFHFPFTMYPFDHLDIQLPVDEKMAVFEKLAQTHVLIHYHGNCCCGTTTYKDVCVPNVFECTFIRKDIHIDNGLNTTPIPGPLDAPNTSNPEICLNWPPFVHSK